MLLVLCSLCHGNKLDEAGNRCIDCAGIGSFPHWKTRPSVDVLKELESTRVILEEAKKSMMDYASGGRLYDEPEAQKKKVALLREAKDYWVFRVQELERDLELNRREEEKDASNGQSVTSG